MAATIAKATGYDANRTKETHRLGSKSSAVEAATWRTFAGAEVFADGSGNIVLRRDGRTVFGVAFPPESTDPIVTAREVADNLRAAATNVLMRAGLDPLEVARG